MYEAIYENPLKITSLNHISVGCKSVNKSVEFYSNVLGFCLIKRPGTFDFDGAWLFNYGIGIHLIQSENPVSLSKNGCINPKDNHISFQHGGRRSKAERVEEGGIQIDQLFFHDPDGTMIEICNCNVLPIVPLVALNQAIVRSYPHTNLILESQQQQQQQAYPIMTRTSSLVAIRL